MFASKDVFLTPPATGGYTIGKSVRLRSSATAYLNRTPASAGNRKTWTWSAWVKRGILSSGYPSLFQGGTTSSDTGSMAIVFAPNDRIYVQGYTTNFLISNGSYRDPSAWYHIVLAMDSTQATATNRLKLYVNGSEVSYATYNNLTQNTDYGINQAASHVIGQSIASFGNNYFDGYLTEINFIDGLQLTPSSFGSTNTTTGVWQPAKYTGTYGTNGFYLNFSSNGTSAALGTDFSGNSNTWTVNNISVTAGSTYDSMTDVPTLSAVSSNYCVMNPTLTNPTATWSMTNGNLTPTRTSGYGCAAGTIGVSSGKWYFEAQVTTAISPAYAHGCGFTSTLDGIGNNNVAGQGVYFGDGTKQVYSGGTTTSYGASWTTGDIIGVALDLDGGTLTFYKNNTSQGSAYTGLSGTFYPVVSGASSSAGTVVMAVNFGQRPFTYTPPTGYVALNTYNLPTSTITNGAAYMAATTYTGTNATLAISNTSGGASFQPDLIWIKSRSTAANHALMDSIRGVANQLQSSTTNAESTNSAGKGLQSFNSGGFTLGQESDAVGGTNANGASYVGWQWKAGTTSSSNTNGSVTTTVSANTTAGFSVVTYTGTGANATFGHGLGVAPSMVITKKRNSASAWVIGFNYSGFTWSTDYFQFDTAAKRTNGAGTVFTAAPTSTVFSLGTDAGENGNGDTFVAYCFAAVAGYSAFGSYTGNGSTDGPFVYLGFRPRWVMVKRSSSTGSWELLDTSRNPYNDTNLTLEADLSSAESTGAGGNWGFDILSNGFKIRGINSEINTSGQTYIYACFAENPFKNALAR